MLSSLTRRVGSVQFQKYLSDAVTKSQRNLRSRTSANQLFKQPQLQVTSSPFLRAVNTMTSNAKKDSKESDSQSKNEIPDGYEQIIEGQAKMIYKKQQKGQAVFYNPVQVQNRDLSILMINMYAERRVKRALRKKLKKEKRKQMLESGKTQKECQNVEFTDDEFKEATKHITSWAEQVEQLPRSDGLCILEALAASGLRSIRYSKEIRGVQHILVNDLDPAAVEQANQNVTYNNVDPSIVQPHLGDANQVMYNRRATQLFPPGQSASPEEQPFDVIDLDPYGSASPFLDAAVQSVKDGGLLCITCTDMKVLSGAHVDTCYGRYGSLPMPRGKYLHELALRIVLYATSTSAARYGRVIKPILSVGMAFYVRLFVEVYDDKAAVQNVSTVHGNVYQSTQCPTFYTVPHSSFNGKVYQPTRGPPVSECEETGAPFKIAGPVWLGPLHDFEVVDEAIARLEANNATKFPLATHKTIHGLLTSVSEELSDVPLYYVLPDLSHVLSSQQMPNRKWRAALHNAGYRCSAQHKEPLALKTDAPPKVIWDIMRHFIKTEAPLSEKKLENNPTAAKMLSKEITTKVDFTVPKGFDRNRKKAQRYPMNPEANWGPKPRATGHKRKQDTIEANNDSVIEKRPKEDIDSTEKLSGGDN